MLKPTLYKGMSFTLSKPSGSYSFFLFKNPLFLQENYELQKLKEKWWKPQQCQVNKKYNFPEG